LLRALVLVVLLGARRGSGLRARGRSHSDEGFRHWSAPVGNVGCLSFDGIVRLLDTFTFEDIHDVIRKLRKVLLRLEGSLEFYQKGGLLQLGPSVGQTGDETLKVDQIGEYVGVAVLIFEVSWHQPGELVFQPSLFLRL
jgi:hypothetical protein